MGFSIEGFLSPSIRIFDIFHHILWHVPIYLYFRDKVIIFTVCCAQLYLFRDLFESFMKNEYC